MNKPHLLIEALHKTELARKELYNIMECNKSYCMLLDQEKNIMEQLENQIKTGDTSLSNILTLFRNQFTIK